MWGNVLTGVELSGDDSKTVSTIQGELSEMVSEMVSEMLSRDAVKRCCQEMLSRDAVKRCCQSVAQQNVMWLNNATVQNVGEKLWKIIFWNFNKNVQLVI